MEYLMSAVITHIQNNWHKYGIAYLVLKDLKDTYSTISSIKSVQETASWVWSKITGLFKKL